MHRMRHRTILSLLVFVSLHQLTATNRCGLPSEYEGNDVTAYAKNNLEKISFPWTVVIRNQIGKFKCLGSIIPELDQNGSQRNSSSLIVTAGNCFRHSMIERWGKPKHFKVYAGIDRVRLFLNDATKSKVRKVKITPLEGPNENIRNGVALATLRKPLVFNKFISPVCLPAKFDVPPEAAICFASTYNKQRIYQELVNFVPGYHCDFGQFPELAKTRGFCGRQTRDSSKKSLGGALFCLINGRGYQYGIVLSQLLIRKALRISKEALHFYGHVTHATMPEGDTASKFIELGSPSSTSSSADESSSKFATASEACSTSAIDAHSQGSSCTENQTPGATKPTKPWKPDGTKPPEERPVQGVFCGDTSSFGKSLESYIEHNNAQYMLPWNAIIATQIRGSVKCMGSLIHTGDSTQSINSTDLVLTAGDCASHFRRTNRLMMSNMRIYVGFSLYSRLRRHGTKRKAAYLRRYGITWGIEKTSKGIALIKLNKPLTRKDGVVPVCLAERNSLPPLHASCYVSHYDKNKHLVEEELVMLTRNPRCLSARDGKERTHSGICTTEEKKTNHVQLGSPMICIIGGRALQYGVYVNHISLEINKRSQQLLGYYSEINTFLNPSPEKPITSPPGGLEKQLPITAPTVSGDASAIPPAVENSQRPVFVSSTSSTESHETDTPTNSLDPPLPLPHGKPSSEDYVIPEPVRIGSSFSGSSFSSSMSTSSSSAHSNSVTENSKLYSAESELRSMDTDQSSRASEFTNVIKIKVNSVKSQTYSPFERYNKEPIVLSSSSSAETEEARSYVENETIAPIPSFPVAENPNTESHGNPKDISLIPLTPVSVTLRTNESDSSSHSSSADSRSSSSVEHLTMQPSIKTPAPFPVNPSSPAQWPPCIVPEAVSSLNSTVDEAICHLTPEDGSDKFVPLPLPIPEYPSISVEPNDQLLLPLPMGYDLSNKTITSHEHILIYGIVTNAAESAGSSSSACNVTVNGNTSISLYPASSGDSISGSISSSHIQGSNILHTTGSISGHTHVSNNVQSGGSLSSHIHESSGVINNGVISSGHSQGSSIIHSSHAEGSSGMQVSGSVSSDYTLAPAGNQYNGSTSISSVHAGAISSSSSVQETIGTKGSGNITINETDGTSGMHISGSSLSQGHGTQETQIIGGMSSGQLHESAGMHSGIISSHSADDLPGASAVHIFDVTGTSAEEICTGTLYVEPGKSYSNRVITAARCVWSKVKYKYKVYVGSLLPRHMTLQHMNKALLDIESIQTVPFYAEHADLKAMGMALITLKHSVKAIPGIQSFPLPYAATAASPSMQCFVSGICEHGMPVRVQYQLLTPNECRSRLGQKFFPSLMYCGIGRKGILKFPVGAPLVCNFYGTWIQFGMYEHAPRSAKVDRFGNEDDEELNELALFMKLDPVEEP